VLIAVGLIAIVGALLEPSPGALRQLAYDYDRIPYPTWASSAPIGPEGVDQQERRPTKQVNEVGHRYDDDLQHARSSARPVGYRLAPQSLARAESAADFARLTRQLQFDEAASVFNRSGGLQSSVISNSTPIIRGPQLGNQQVVKALTADGSNIADWAKYTTQTFQSPSGPFQVHFYRNSATGAVNYAYDYKVIFNGPR
jgi:hypothetical protein